MTSDDRTLDQSLIFEDQHRPDSWNGTRLEMLRLTTDLEPNLARRSPLL